MLRETWSSRHDLLDRPTAHVKLATHPRDRVHALHPLPPVHNHRTGTAASQRTGGQFWTPIPDLTGSTFHADPHTKVSETLLAHRLNVRPRRAAQGQAATAEQQLATLLLIKQCLTTQRVFDRGSLCAATCPRTRLLPVRLRSDILVVFESYAGWAEHCSRCQPYRRFPCRRGIPASRAPRWISHFKCDTEVGCEGFDWGAVSEALARRGIEVPVTSPMSVSV